MGIADGWRSLVWRGTLLIACATPLGFTNLNKATTGLDPIANIQARIESGSLKLTHEPKHGYLLSLLKELKIDPSSQVLVFSKSSLQAEFISPKTPRAMYFNDHTYVGWIPGAPMIEIMSVHPTRGAIFYTISQEQKAKQLFDSSQRECVPCHGQSASFRAAGLIARSSPTSPAGYPRTLAQSFNVVPSLPIEKRWGGWYVSGSHGKIRHMGNEIAVGTDEKYKIDTEKGANVKDLGKYFDTKPYLTPHSDIAALMVLEQQMFVQNVLSRVSIQTRDLLKRTKDGEAFDRATRTAFEEHCESLVEAILCSNEAPIEAPLAGTSGFATYFSNTAPKDSKGRSLSQLDLTTRLLKYSCSPLIYSESFDALPSLTKQQVWKRVKAILDGEEISEYKHLTSADRKALAEILSETRPEFSSL